MFRAACWIGAGTLTLALAGAVGAWNVTVSGGNITLTISSATAGQNPAQVTNEACTLSWDTAPTDPTAKITVRTNLASAQFTLTVLATAVSAGDGTAAGTVTLTTTDQDFVTGVPPDIPPADPGTCTLRYTASATAANGTGTDSHTITYTIVAQ